VDDDLTQFVYDSSDQDICFLNLIDDN